MIGRRVFLSHSTKGAAGLALLTAVAAELRIVRALIDRTAAAGIAAEAEFFSFGTNDPTQTALGVSRVDAGRFLTHYVEQGIFERDPFVSIDEEGVGELIALAAERGRGARPGFKLGICGEHGGDPASIAFSEKVGLDYVSASPYRVPIARLAPPRRRCGTGRRRRRWGYDPSRHPGASRDPGTPAFRKRFNSRVLACAGMTPE